MMHPDWIGRQAHVTLERLWRRISSALRPQPSAEQAIYERRLRRESNADH